MLSNVLLLVFSTAIWGYGFIATRWSMEVLDPFWANALRFAIAGIGSLPFLIYKKSFTRKNHILKKAFISSIFLLGILLFQTIGLSTTTVAKSGFITTLYTLFIPIITMILFKKRYRITFWLLILTAMIGMGLMCNLEVKDLNIGDLYTLICSVFGALHIIYVGRIANTIESPIEFNFLQSFFVGILSLILALSFVGATDVSMIFAPGNNALKGLLYLGIVSSMISFTAQVYAQKKIPDHIAGLIFLLESPFAALFGFLALGETLNTMNLFGAGLILTSVILVPVLGREVTAGIHSKGRH